MSDPRERRASRRISFVQQETVLLRIEVNDTLLMAEVQDFSKAGMQLRVLAEHRGLLSSGTHLSNSVIVLPDGSERFCPQLTVLECRRCDDDLNLVRVSTTDEATRACLWLSMQTLNESERQKQRKRGMVLKPSEIPRVPARGVYTEDARLQRLQFARDLSGSALDNLQDTSLVAQKLTGNIEAFIGGVEVPVGLAGPLLFQGRKARGIICAPFATTEGALVASASRGAAAISRSGGVSTRVIAQRMLRVPLFVLNDMQAAFLFARWIRDHQEEIADQIRKVSNYAKLLSVQPHVQGRLVHVTFLYETGDAAGQNMTTATTWRACQWLMSQMKYFETIKFDNFVIEANMSGDKKVNYQSFINGRGTRVIAECHIPREICEQVLKVSPEQIEQANQGLIAGSLQVGMIGYNVNVANTVAAIFTACGQDIACVHESSLAQLHLQQVEDGISASLLLPSLIIGTIGGGTHLPRQNELLGLMDCAGSGKADRLAEIICGFALSLDLSTLSALAGGQFASAHERLGRNRPVQWFVREDLNPAFFEPGLKRVVGDEDLRCLHVEQVETKLGSSIISELTSRKIQKLVGLYAYRLDYQIAERKESAEVLVKLKPLDSEVVLMVNSLASMCGRKLASEYSKARDQTGFVGCHLRELALYQQLDPRFREHMPRVYETYQNDEREAFVLVLERLRDMACMDSANDPSCWGQPEIEAAVTGAAQFHSVWYARETELAKQPWLFGYQTHANMTRLLPLWEALAVHASEEFPEWFDQEDLAQHRKLLHAIPEWWKRLEKLPRTLIHNDFNPRNICLRKIGSKYKLCAYDWELATLQLPQHDLAELLCFVLRPEVSLDEVEHYVEYHRCALEQATQRKIDAKQWRYGFRLALFDLTVNRIALYAMAHTFRHYGFMERVAQTLRQLLRYERL